MQHVLLLHFLLVVIYCLCLSRWEGSSFHHYDRRVFQHGNFVGIALARWDATFDGWNVRSCVVKWLKSWTQYDIGAAILCGNFRQFYASILCLCWK